nr:recombinase family protein [uncultured Rhodoferax sp.]
MKKGYARVSTSEQETTLQLNVLKRAGVKSIYQEKRSGVATRPQLQKLMSGLRPGDVVVVYKVDRLARSLLDLLGILQRIEAAGAAFQSLTEPIDTSTGAGRMMMHMLGAFAEFERGLIRERTMAGQKAAKEKGIHCGRPRVLTKQEEQEVLKLRAQGIYTLKTLSVIFECSESVIKRTIYRVQNPDSSTLL